MNEATSSCWMARCFWRWRNVLICVCTPCIILFMLFLYVAVMVVFSMHDQSFGSKLPIASIFSDTPHFVASGLTYDKDFSPMPKSFWAESEFGGFWNQLQLEVDRQFNPILLRRQVKLESRMEDPYLLQKSFFKAINSESMRQLLKDFPRYLQRFVLYMQRREVPILLQPEGVCGAQGKDETQPPLLLLAIKTKESNAESRHAIRQTWGQVGWVRGLKSNGSSTIEYGGYVRRVFLLGKQTTRRPSLTMDLEMESKRYGDILQWDFDDTFFNLTLKDVLFWTWFSKSCGEVRFVLKGDDDVFVNTPKMVAYLLEQLNKPQAEENLKDFMVGDVIGAAAPNRDNTSKYFIPEGFYHGHYPRYAGGGGVLYSGLLIRRLLEVSNSIHLFPIDDVYVGMCMLRLNAFPIHHAAFLTFDFPKEQNRDEACLYHTIMLVHKRTPGQVMQLWASVSNTESACSHVSLKVEKKFIPYTPKQ